MKRILSLIITLSLVVTVFALGTSKVAAEVPANDCTTSHTVVIHYHRWDNDYTNMDFWAWGTGTDGSGNPQIVGEDDFGAVAYLCVNGTDADDNAGLIPRLNDWSYKDGTDVDANGGDDKSIPLRDEAGDLDGFDENGIKHVYVLQGSPDVYTVDMDSPYFQKEGFGTLVVVYYDPTESYEGWNMWTWGTGTGGTEAPNYFQYRLGIDQGPETDKFKVGIFNIAADADDTIGFIVRTDAWEKKYADDLFVDVTGIKGSGTQFTFYIAGEGDFYDNFMDFEAVVNLFEITNAVALGPGSIEVNFNKEIVTVVDEVDVFDASKFMVKDKDGTAVAISNVSYNSTSEANDIFTLILDEDLMGSMAPYTVEYDYGADMPATFEVDVDADAPEIFVIGAVERELELGDTYTLPAFSAYDTVGEESVEVYDVKVKDGHGTVDTRTTGVYEIVLIATDKFGNVAEKTITVTVIDPCEAPEANNNPVNLAALFVGLPLAAGAIVTSRRWS